MFRYILLSALLLPFTGIAQSIAGRVVDKHNNPIEGASVVWLNNNKKGITTKRDGSFVIAKDAGDKKLVASHSGFLKDTIDINQQDTVLFVLQIKGTLQDVVVTAGKAGTIMSNLDAVKTEILTSVELKKSACCD